MVVVYTFEDIIDNLPQTESFSLPVLKQNPLKIEFINGGVIETTYNGSEPPLPFADSNVFHASIVQWRRLTALEGDCKAVYEVTFDIEGSNYKFKAGDTIGVIPHNVESDVNFIISHLNLLSTADLYYSLSVDAHVKGSKIPAHIPVRSTLRHVLTHCVDLRSVLKKLFLLALSKYTKHEKERKLLEYLCSKEGSPAYTTHILNRNLCLLDIFTIFKSCKPPIEVLLANLPRLLPRPYSIVNSGLKCDQVAKICYSVMCNNNRKGLTTGWLESIILNKNSSLEHQLENLSLTNGSNKRQKVPIYLRKNISMFSMPESLETPLILIGPGTGVSPFIGFLEEREYIKAVNPDISLGDVWLFFGCRNPELDFIYKEELNEFLSKGILNRLCTAFSRVENQGIKYIQDSITHKGKDVTKLIKNGADVFICGDLKSMAAEIKEVLIKCLMEHDSTSLQDAQNIILDMQKEKKYIVDTWS